MERARDGAGVSQEELAEAFEVTQQTVSNWEIGRHPIPDEHRRRWAEMIGIDAADLNAWIADEAEQKAKASQRELSQAKRGFSEMMKAMKVVEQFVTQYEELGHTYRQLDSNSEKILEILEQMSSQQTKILEQMSTQQTEILRLLKGQGKR